MAVGILTNSLSVTLWHNVYCQRLAGPIPYKAGLETTKTEAQLAANGRISSTTGEPIRRPCLQAWVFSVQQNQKLMKSGDRTNLIQVVRSRGMNHGCSPWVEV